MARNTLLVNKIEDASRHQFLTSEDESNLQLRKNLCDDREATSPIRRYKPHTKRQSAEYLTTEEKIKSLEQQNKELSQSAEMNGEDYDDEWYYEAYMELQCPVLWKAECAKFDATSASTKSTSALAETIAEVPSDSDSVHSEEGPEPTTVMLPEGKIDSSIDIIDDKGKLLTQINLNNLDNLSPTKSNMLQSVDKNNYSREILQTPNHFRYLLHVQQRSIDKKRMSSHAMWSITLDVHIPPLSLRTLLHGRASTSLRFFKVAEYIRQRSHPNVATWRLQVTGQVGDKPTLHSTLLDFSTSKVITSLTMDANLQHPVVKSKIKSTTGGLHSAKTTCDMTYFVIPNNSEPCVQRLLPHSSGNSATESFKISASHTDTDTANTYAGMPPLFEDVEPFICPVDTGPERPTWIIPANASLVGADPGVEYKTTPEKMLMSTPVERVYTAAKIRIEGTNAQGRWIFHKNSDAHNARVRYIARAVSIGYMQKRRGRLQQRFLSYDPTRAPPSCYLPFLSISRPYYVMSIASGQTHHDRPLLGTACRSPKVQRCYLCASATQHIYGAMYVLGP